MSIKTVLFDLDGTLLSMDQDVFVKAYFKDISDYHNGGFDEIIEFVQDLM